MTTINTGVVLKYVFKNDNKKNILDLYELYLNMYKLFSNYEKNLIFLDFINRLVRDFPYMGNISDKKILDNDKYLGESVYIIYTNLLRYIFNKETDILKHFTSINFKHKENKLDLYEIFSSI